MSGGRDRLRKIAWNGLDETEAVASILEMPDAPDESSRRHVRESELFSIGHRHFLERPLEEFLLSQWNDLHRDWGQVERVDLGRSHLLVEFLKPTPDFEPGRIRITWAPQPLRTFKWARRSWYAGFPTWTLTLVEGKLRLQTTGANRSDDLPEPDFNPQDIESLTKSFQLWISRMGETKHTNDASAPNLDSSR